MINCNKCGIEKLETEFYYDKSNNRYGKKCKDCYKTNYKNKIEQGIVVNNKDYAKQYRESHKKYWEKYRETHSGYHKTKSAEYYRNNTEHCKDLVKKRLSDPINRKNHNLQIQKYRKNRALNDPEYAFKIAMRWSIKKMFKNHSINGKLYSSKKYGINFKEIFTKLGSRPGQDYHLDHIIPVCVFNLDNPEHPRLLNSPHNLRWISSTENTFKNDIINYELISENPELLKIAISIGITKEHHNTNGRNFKK